MNFLGKIFTWWNGATIGTHLWSARNGEHVGTDAQGNKYYRSKKTTGDGRERRWVIYEGANDASRVPSEWHGWLHHTEALPPPSDGYDRHGWQQDHLPNLTGTDAAYRPPGHTLEGGRRSAATGDYQPWTPN